MSELERYRLWLKERNNKLVADNGGRSETVEQCIVCGFTRMVCRSVDKVEEPIITRQEMSPDYCPCCTEVRHRTPEVWSWVLGVSAHNYVKLMALIDELDWKSKNE